MFSSSVKSFISLAQKVSTSAKYSVSEIQNQIIFQEVVDVKCLNVVHLQIVTQFDKVLVLKMPVVQDKMVQCLIRLIYVPLKLRNATIYFLNGFQFLKEMSFLQWFVTFELQSHVNNKSREQMKKNNFDVI